MPTSTQSEDSHGLNAASVSLISVVSGFVGLAIIGIILKCLLRAYRRRRNQREYDLQKVQAPSVYSKDSNDGMFLPLYSPLVREEQRNKLRRQRPRRPTSTPIFPMSAALPTMPRPASLGSSTSHRPLNIVSIPPRTLPVLTDSFGAYPYSPADYDQYTSPSQTSRSQSRKSTPDLPAIMEEAPPVPEIPELNKSKKMTSEAKLSATAPQIQGVELSSGRFSWGSNEDVRETSIPSPTISPPPPKTPKSLRRVQRNVSSGRLSALLMSSPVSPMGEEFAAWNRANDLEAPSFKP